MSSPGRWGCPAALAACGRNAPKQPSRDRGSGRRRRRDRCRHRRACRRRGGRRGRAALVVLARATGSAADLDVERGAICRWIWARRGFTERRATRCTREANRLGLATKIFDVGSFDGGGSAVYYAGNGTGCWTATRLRSTPRVIGYLENTADAQDAGRRSLRTFRRSAAASG